MNLKASVRYAMFAAFLAPFGASQANAFDVLYRFCSQANCTDGLWPYAGVVADANGNLYGTTGAGGIPTCKLYGCGTVFKLTPKGKETVLHAFSSDSDGSGPYGGLVMDAGGNLYGTTATGGGSGCGGSGYGCGTIFKIAPDGTETILYSFAGNSDGAYPLAGLLLDADGNLYGATEYGGGGTGCIVQFGGCGTAFKLSASGREKVLYAFSGGTDGAYPLAALVADGKGALYGTTSGGGDTAGSNCNLGATPGCGVVFKIAAGGKEKTLYTFTGGNDGWSPVSRLALGKGGTLYGTTQAGGSTSACSGVGCGIIFSVTPRGTETVLYAFTGGSDGAHPSAGVLDKKGNLYGTTYSGGGNADAGTVFKLAPDGTLSVLEAFSGGTNGSAPVADLLAGANGKLFGTTEFGSDGVVFEMKR